MIDLSRAARLLVLLLPLSLSGCFGVMSAKDLSADLRVATPLEPGTYVAIGTSEPQKPFALTKADDGTYAIETDDPTDTLMLRLLALPNLPADTYLVQAIDEAKSPGIFQYVFLAIENDVVIVKVPRADALVGKSEIASLFTQDKLGTYDVPNPADTAAVLTALAATPLDDLLRFQRQH